MSAIMMNGIKSSDPQILIRQVLSGNDDARPGHLYHLLAGDRINITFLCLDYLSERKRIACCAEPGKPNPIPYYTANSGGRIEYAAGTGLLTVFPHRFSLESFGALVSFMGAEGHRFHAMASSTATITFVVDAADQSRTAAEIARFMGIAPPAPVPAEQDYDHIAVSLRKDPETVATYVEAKIKTYGIRVRSGLVLCRFDVEMDRLAGWGKRIGEMDASDFQFCFVSGDWSGDDRVRMHLLIDSEKKEGMADRLGRVLGGHCAAKMDIIPDVGWIGFQGPHFGDRYGIADQAFSALRGHSIPVFLGGCVGAALSIVLPAASLGDAETALSENFETPR